MFQQFISLLTAKDTLHNKKIKRSNQPLCREMIRNKSFTKWGKKNVKSSGLCSRGPFQKKCFPKTYGFEGWDYVLAKKKLCTKKSL